VNAASPTHGTAFGPCRMNIVVYCQHVLGVGHFFRTLEICRALERHRVRLISGGPPLEAALPPHVAEIRLPPLHMDSEFKTLLPEAGADAGAVLQERRDRLLALLAAEPADLFIIELYPFGRKAFRAEIDPLLAAMSAGRLSACGVVCSVRDILVEKGDPAGYESRVVSTLNRFFDAVLVHADPAFVRLEETFGRVSEIEIPLVYTGYVTPAPASDARRRVRAELGVGAGARLVVASAGGGSVGMPLLEAAVRAFEQPEVPAGTRLVVFTGPFLPAAEFERLRALGGGRTQVERFSSDFLSLLAAADLSISMAGYNTTMNLLAARVPALVWPFAQNREQRMRSERLAARGALRVLEDADLDPARLAVLVRGQLSAPRPPGGLVDLGGAAAVARWVDRWRPGRTRNRPPA
jgi:predicted glycosyltransferase